MNVPKNTSEIDPENLLIPELRINNYEDALYLAYDLYRNGVNDASYDRLLNEHDIPQLVRVSAKFLKFALIPLMRIHLNRPWDGTLLYLNLIGWMTPETDDSHFKNRFDELQRILTPEEKREIAQLVFRMKQEQLSHPIYQEDFAPVLNFWRQYLDGAGAADAAASPSNPPSNPSSPLPPKGKPAAG